MDKIHNDNLSGLNEGALYPNQPLKYLTASSIIGDKVRNGKDEHLGEIKDIMLDIHTGKIDYFVVEYGGFLGIGIKYFAVPFRFLQVDAERKMFIFDQPREVLEKAPGFDMDHWPDTNLPLGKVQSYWQFI